MKKLSRTNLKCLRLVGTFGFLPTRELAMLAWPHLSAESALASAQTATMTLRKAGLLLARSLYARHQDGAERKAAKAEASGPLAFVLTSKAATYLNELSLGAWVEDDDATMTWWADGYNLSLANHEHRRPLIDLLHEVMRVNGQGDLLPVGGRGLKRGVSGLGRFEQFDAVLLKPDLTLAYGCYLAHHVTATAGQEVGQLAKGQYQFLIAAHRPEQLAALRKVRALTNAEMSNWLHDHLPSVDA